MLALVGATLIMMACGANPHNTSVDNGKSNATNHPQAAIDPCTLLTKEDAEAALGTLVKKVAPQGLSTAETCQYLREKVKNLGQTGESVTLQVHFGGGRLFDSYIKEAEQSFETRGQPVEGVGDKAIFNAGQFVVLNNDDFFVITVVKKVSEAEKLATSKALASQVITRLKRASIPATSGLTVAVFRFVGHAIAI